MNNVNKTKKTCSKCEKPKKINTDFYSSYSLLHSDRRLTICKHCLADIAGKNYEHIQEMLRNIDRPWIPHLWDTAKATSSPIGEYMKLISMKDFRHKTWADSEENEAALESVDDTENKIPPKDQDTSFDIEELKEKYGYGYPDDEYILFEKKYRQLRTSFQLVTTMHEEYFREYCINKVKETLAKAKGDFKQAKEWALMVKDVAEAGKLKPSQMSKADLSAGLDGFGQLARMVEENYELMPILPKFIEKPKDKVDVTLWCFVNYVRDLKGLPECSYKEIYDFYEKRRKDYEENTLDTEYESVDENFNKEVVLDE